MPTLSSSVQDFAAHLSAGDPLGAMERYYAEDVVVFENRALARAGRAACLSHEREQLALQVEPPVFKLTRFAVSESEGHAFLEYTVRFKDADGRPQRLEQVAVQDWHAGKISQERFYYEGVVDEGDAELVISSEPDT